MALHKTLHHISSVSFVNRTWAKNAERREINFFEQEIVFFSFAMLFFQLAMCGWMDGWMDSTSKSCSFRESIQAESEL